MAYGETIVRFENVTFGHDPKKPLLNAVNFSVRDGSKITFMGQNGAGKSTIFKLMSKELRPDSGEIHIQKDLTIGRAHQVIPRDDRELTVEQFFQKCFDEKKYDIGRRIDEVLAIVNLNAPHDRIVKSFSGGQQARLLLAAAIIANPDLLLLDEPTNNLDKEGINHLLEFIIGYEKTVIVISHDADFLNAFTEGVLYLDVHSRKVEQYVGNYYDVVEQIASRIEKENMQNVRMEKVAKQKKEQAEVFAHKGGKLRLVAKKMREAAAEMEENKVEVRREDRTIREFEIPVQQGLSGDVLRLTSYSVIRHHKPVEKTCAIYLRKHQHLLLSGPNGIGKSTLLESIVNGSNKGARIAPDTKVGYYRQDFSNLDFDQTVYESLKSAMDESIEGKVMEHKLRSTAAGFLITSEWIYSKIGTLSEGQKGLVSFARLVLQEPGLLILDEPTNHINFRHIPVIAEALDKYEGAMVLVSHIPEFVEKIRIDTELELV